MKDAKQDLNDLNEAELLDAATAPPPRSPVSRGSNRRLATNAANKREASPKADKRAKSTYSSSPSLAPAPASSAASLPPPALSAKKSALLRVVRTVLGTVLVLAVAGALVVGLRRFVRTSPRFGVTEYVVHGTDRRPAAEIVDAAGLKRGDNIFQLDLEASRKKLLADPWIIEARMSRRLPGTVTIDVRERKAAGLVAAGETYLVTREGEVFKKLEAQDPTDLPVVTGISLTEVLDDRVSVQKSIRRALDLSDEYARTDLAARYPIQEVNVRPDGTMSLTVGKSAIALMMGKEPFRRKLEQASRVLRETERRNAKIDAVLLDNDARPERVVVRMR